MAQHLLSVEVFSAGRIPGVRWHADRVLPDETKVPWKPNTEKGEGSVTLLQHVHSQHEYLTLQNVHPQAGEDCLWEDATLFVGVRHDEDSSPRPQRTHDEVPNVSP